MKNPRLYFRQDRIIIIGTVPVWHASDSGAELPSGSDRSKQVDLPRSEALPLYQRSRSDHRLYLFLPHVLSQLLFHGFQLFALKPGVYGFMTHNAENTVIGDVIVKFS